MKKLMRLQILCLSLIIAALLLYIAGCAHYRFGQLDRALPGGYDRVAIPMFVNDTHEVGVESYFTQALRTEFERSRLARVTSKADAQVILEGTIKSVDFVPGVFVSGGTNTEELTTPNPAPTPTIIPGPTPTPNPITGIAPTATPIPPLPKNSLPANTTLSKQYTASILVHIIARKVADNTILWTGDFTNSRVYLAPLIGDPRNGLNSANSIYNQSSRSLTAAALAKDMMSEAHDRITENF
jgi:hypothetical protein